jgi:hypothetical protein
MADNPPAIIPEDPRTVRTVDVNRIKNAPQVKLLDSNGTSIYWVGGAIPVYLSGVLPSGLTLVTKIDPTQNTVHADNAFALDATLLTLNGLITTLNGSVATNSRMNDISTAITALKTEIDLLKTELINRVKGPVGAVQFSGGTLSAMGFQSYLSAIQSNTANITSIATQATLSGVLSYLQALGTQATLSGVLSALQGGLAQQATLSGILSGQRTLATQTTLSQMLSGINGLATQATLSGILSAFATLGTQATLSGLLSGLAGLGTQVTASQILSALSPLALCNNSWNYNSVILSGVSMVFSIFACTGFNGVNGWIKNDTGASIGVEYSHDNSTFKATIPIYPGESVITNCVKLAMIRITNLNASIQANIRVGQQGVS